MRNSGGWMLAALLLAGTAQAGGFGGTIESSGISEADARTQLSDAHPGMVQCLVAAHQRGERERGWIRIDLAARSARKRARPRFEAAPELSGDLAACLSEALRAAVLEPEPGTEARVTTWIWRGARRPGVVAARSVEGGIDAAWSRDRERLAVVGGDTVTVLSEDLTGELLQMKRASIPGVAGGVPKPAPSALRATWGPEGSLAVGYSDGEIRVWAGGLTEAAPPEATGRVGKGAISALSSGPDGRLFVATVAGELAVATGRAQVIAQERVKVVGVEALAPPDLNDPGTEGVAQRGVGWTDEGPVALFAGDAVQLDGDSLARLALEEGIIHADQLLVAAVSPGGAWIAWGTLDGSVWVRRRGGDGAVTRLSFDESTPGRARPELGYRLSAQEGTMKDGTTHFNVGDPEGERQARRALTDSGYRNWPMPVALAWAEGDFRLAVATSTGGVLIWDPQGGSGATIRHLPARGRVLAWHPYGRRLAVVSPRGVQIWSTLEADSRARDLPMDVRHPKGLLAIIGTTAAPDSRWKHGGVHPGEPVALGSIDLDALHEAVGAALAGVDSRWADGGGLAGTLTVRVKLEQNGSVTVLAVAVDDLEDPELTAWVTSQLSTIELPKSETAVKVSYPILFD